MKTLIFAGLAGLAAATSAGAKEADTMRQTVGAASASETNLATETIAIAVQDGRDSLWAGTLRLGGPYGNASFSQSRNEFAAPCAGGVRPGSGQAMASQQLNFNISRYNPQQEPDRFSINLNWSKPLIACQGEGNDSFGFNRVIAIPRGQSVTVEGSGGLSVRVSRPR
jgi:hypothetical protein